jgi:hypothetical protein
LEKQQVGAIETQMSSPLTTEQDRLARVTQILGNAYWNERRDMDYELARKERESDGGTRILIYLAGFIIVLGIAWRFMSGGTAVVLALVVPWAVMAYLTHRSDSDPDPLHLGGAERMQRLEQSERKRAEHDAQIFLKIISSEKFGVEDIGNKKRLWRGEKIPLVASRTAIASNSTPRLWLLWRKTQICMV